MEDFNEKAKTWDQNEERIIRTKAVAHIMKQNIPFNKEMRLLEYGCGTGLLSLNLDVPYEMMILADNSEGMLEQLQIKLDALKDSSIQALKLDLSQEGATDVYDVIYNMMVMHHIKDTEQILDQFVAHLNIGGYLCIIDLEEEDGTFHSEAEDVHKGFDKKLLGSLLEKKGLSITYNETVYSMVRKRSDGAKTYSLFMIVGRLDGSTTH